MKNIILCGFMGCGKSTVGKDLAELLNWDFIDMDAYIEDKAGMTVKEIFAAYGEVGFRDMEHDACVQLAKCQDKIIATGGGTLTFDRNTKVLKESGKIVFINCSYDALCTRLSTDTTRPLLQCDNRNEKIKELLSQRSPIYRKVADIIVNGDLTPSTVAQSIAQLTAIS